MTVCIFTGPTIQPNDAAAHLDAVYLPPAEQGDVFAVIKKCPVAIGIIDGYFHRVPAVWHKEILWALSKGIHVFGSASMGALRAAELHSFGMTGVGHIFEEYRDGRISNDDEVAVTHGPKELGYIALSEALANMRPTLANALTQGVITGEVHEALVRIAEATFFPKRTYEGLLADAENQQLPKSQITDLSKWLTTGKINQKRLDAVEMLKTIAAFVHKKPKKLQINYHVEQTYLFDNVAR